MKILPALGFLALVGCATAPVPKTSRLAEKAGAHGSGHEVQLEPVRVETRAGTFLVNPGHAEDFAKALAGESTPTRFYAGADL
jgi:hypothetical protein